MSSSSSRSSSSVSSSSSSLSSSSSSLSSSSVSSSSSSLSSSLSSSSSDCTWLGIDNTNYDSDCGDTGGNIVADTLKGSGYWQHEQDHTHFFVVNLGAHYIVKYVRGRSNTNFDPEEVNIYISGDNSTWVQIATFDRLWDNTNDWVVITTTPTKGRYVKVEITITEDGANNYIEFGHITVPFQIFDVCGTLDSSSSSRSSSSSLSSSSSSLSSSSVSSSSLSSSSSSISSSSISSSSSSLSSSSSSLSSSSSSLSSVSSSSSTAPTRKTVEIKRGQLPPSSIKIKSRSTITGQKDIKTKITITEKKEIRSRSTFS